MNVTYITGIFDINKNVEKDLKRDSNYLLENIKYLYSLPLILFADNYYYNLLKPIVENFSNVKLVNINLENLYIYNLIISKNKEKELQLPSNRSHVKDTLKYMALINSKVELLKIGSGMCKTEYVAWIDCGIRKVLSSTESIVQLKNLKIKPGIMKVINPGQYVFQISESRLFYEAVWMFLGGFFICNEKIIDLFYSNCVETINEIINKGWMVWEVNIWAYMYYKKNLFYWYYSLHDDNMLKIPNCLKM